MPSMRTAPESPRRLARVTLATGFALLAVALVLPHVRHTLDTDGHKLIDLEVYRYAGRAVLDGARIYDFTTPEHLPFTYPPTAALLAVPLALLPWPLVGGAWTLLNLGLLAAVLWWLGRPVWRPLGPAAPLTFAVVAWSFPFRDNLVLGQVNLVLMTLVLLDCLLPRTRWPRGALVGLATAVKLTPGLFVPYLWLSGRRREAVNAVAAFGLLAAVTFALLPRDSVRYWFGEMLNPRRLGNNHYTSNQSLRGMALHLQLDGVALLALVVPLALLTLWLVLTRAPKLSRAGDELAALAVVGCGTLLLSPVSWVHHAVWFLPAVIVLLDGWRHRGRVVLGLGLLALIAYKTPYYGAYLTHGTSGLPWVGARLLQSCFTLAALAVVAGLPARTGADPVGARPGGDQAGGDRAGGDRARSTARAH